MPKNNYAQKLQEKQKLREYAIRRQTRQQFLDFTTIALGRLGYGEKRLSEFEAMLSKVYIEYCDEFLLDREDDKDMEYTKACLDRELKQYCGSKFVPFEKRYYE